MPPIEHHLHKKSKFEFWKFLYKAIYNKGGGVIIVKFDTNPEGTGIDAAMMVGIHKKATPDAKTIIKTFSWLWQMSIKDAADEKNGVTRAMFDLYRTEIEHKVEENGISSDEL